MNQDKAGGLRMGKHDHYRHARCLYVTVAAKLALIEAGLVGLPSTSNSPRVDIPKVKA